MFQLEQMEHPNATLTQYTGSKVNCLIVHSTIFYNKLWKIANCLNHLSYIYSIQELQQKRSKTTLYPSGGDNFQLNCTLDQVC